MAPEELRAMADVAEEMGFSVGCECGRFRPTPSPTSDTIPAPPPSFEDERESGVMALVDGPHPELLREDEDTGEWVRAEAEFLTLGVVNGIPVRIV